MKKIFSLKWDGHAWDWNIVIMSCTVTNVCPNCKRNRFCLQSKEKKHEDFPHKCACIQLYAQKMISVSCLFKIIKMTRNFRNICCSSQNICWSYDSRFMWGKWLTLCSKATESSGMLVLGSSRRSKSSKVTSNWKHRKTEAPKISSCHGKLRAKVHIKCTLDQHVVKNQHSTNHTRN